MINTIQVSVSGSNNCRILKHISGFRNTFNWTKYQLFPYSIYKDWHAYITSGSIWIYDNFGLDVTHKFVGTTIVLGESKSCTIGEKQLFKWEKQINNYLNNITNDSKI